MDFNRSVDDTPYGGGAGMVLRLEPVVACLNEVLAQASQQGIAREETKVLLTAADGHVYNQRLARDYAEFRHLVILCGHYKGFDERIVEYVDGKVGIGDYVLSGGELPAMVIVDAIARLLPGVVSNFDSVATDSHWDGLLGAPCYTRPESFEGLKVPEVLLSGHHRRIEEFRFIKALERTRQVRPELLESCEFTREQKKIIRKHGLSLSANDRPQGLAGEGPGFCEAEEE